jgi:hypothetical protein
MSKISQVVQEYQEVHGLSLRKFADALNEKLINTDVSHATVARWKDREKPSEPDVRFLFECLATYQDWRRAFAVDCLNEMFPDLVQSGVVEFRLPLAG